MNKPTPDTGSMPGTALETIGSTFSADAGRDAIHLATIAVTSDEKLFAGMHVGLTGDRKVSGQTKEWVGIVDPFLNGPVFPGTHFWLVLYPRTITSLRHVWTHPAFENELAVPVVVETKIDAKAEKRSRARIGELVVTIDASGGVLVERLNTSWKGAKIVGVVLGMVRSGV